MNADNTNCKHEPSGLVCRDGGSDLCVHCNKLYHLCPFNSPTRHVHEGGPGPMYCKECIEYVMLETTTRE